MHYLKLIFYTIVGTALAVLGLLLALKNNTLVTLDLILWQSPEMSFMLLSLLTLLLGFLLGYLFGRLSSWSRSGK